MPEIEIDEESLDAVATFLRSTLQVLDMVGSLDSWIVVPDEGVAVAARAEVDARLLLLCEFLAPRVGRRLIK